MLHHEFESLIGRKATNEEYTRANGIYMTVDVDKQIFCKEWEAGLKDSEVLAQLDERMTQAATKANRQGDVMFESGKALLYAISIGKASEDLESVAASLMDRKEIVRYRLKGGHKLSKEDKEYILENLI